MTLMTNRDLSLLLCAMIRANRREIARAILLEPDIDVEIRDDDGMTPLLLAADSYQHHLVAVLTAFGANPNAPDPFGRTALMKAAARNDARSVRHLLKAGAFVNVATRAERWTALMWAASRDARKAAQLLLEHEADHTMTDRRGRTAADIARLNRFPRMAALLEPLPAPS